MQVKNIKTGTMVLSGNAVNMAHFKEAFSKDVEYTE
jgi:hypothetical protein